MFGYGNRVVDSRFLCFPFIQSGPRRGGRLRVGVDVISDDAVRGDPLLHPGRHLHGRKRVLQELG